MANFPTPKALHIAATKGPIKLPSSLIDNTDTSTATGAAYARILNNTTSTPEGLPLNHQSPLVHSRHRNRIEHVYGILDMCSEATNITSYQLVLCFLQLISGN